MYDAKLFEGFDAEDCGIVLGIGLADVAADGDDGVGGSGNDVMIVKLEMVAMMFVMTEVERWC